VLNWLIMTYSNPGETVLDFTMGAGSTGVAAKMTGRNFIGIERDETYFHTATRRIELCDEAVTRSDIQLTTQLHEDMKTTPDVVHEVKFREELKTDKATKALDKSPST